MRKPASTTDAGRRGAARIGAAVLAAVSIVWFTSAHAPQAVGSTASSGSTGTTGGGARVQDGPDVPGLGGMHPLDEAAVGSVLIGELACASCHADLPTASAHPKQAPDLTAVGARIAPDFLRAFIADPTAVQPGTTMPHLLADVPAAKRAAVAEAITQFLLATSAESSGQDGATFTRGEVEADAAAEGRALFHSVGCIACHDAREPASDGGLLPEPRPGAVGLAHVPDKWALAPLADFLYDPLRVRPSGRMPDMSLSRDEAHALAHYLMVPSEGDALPRAPRSPDVPTADAPATDGSFPLADVGRAHFQRLGCASCHSLPGATAPESVPLGDEPDTTAACLAADPREGSAAGSRAEEARPVPDYALSDEQRSAIRVALAARDRELTADQHLAVTLTAFNCIACHERDDYGGVAQALDAYFGTDEPALGDHVRIPPRLTEVGAKLNPAWLQRVLFERARVRPYMHTRMPQYGVGNLGGLTEHFAAADPAPPIEIPVFRGQERGEMHEAARQLVGSDMLGCINCHAFNGKPSPAMNGIDLTTTAARLQPAWFEAFLINPQAHRPGIIMPQSWPGGEAIRDDVLDGDTGKQIDAIWSYLEQGRTARDPKGIRSEPTVLTAEDEPRTYRGRSQIAGFRGIAVGFPSGLSYAFNAETGALSGVWKGGFVRVRWDGQGAGDFHPSTRAVQLPKDLGIARLPDEDAPWPLLPVMTEEEPVNPDPLYPRRLGYQFDGYAFDDDGTPTLFYRSGSVSIEDRTEPAADAATTTLIRTLRFHAPESEQLSVRLAAGTITRLAPGRYALDGLTLVVPPEVARLRPFGDTGGSELLLDLRLPATTRSIEIRYELP